MANGNILFLIETGISDFRNEKRSRQDKLEQVVDDLRKKHGVDTIRLGSQDNTRRLKPIHSIPNSVAHRWRAVYKYYAYIIRGDRGYAKTRRLNYIIPLSRLY